MWYLPARLVCEQKGIVMKITVSELPSVAPQSNPLLVQAQFVSQLAASGVFFQVLSGLTEVPVKVCLHDKISGERRLLIIECAGASQVSSAGKAELPPQPGKVKAVQLFHGDAAIPAPTVVKDKVVKVTPKPPKSTVAPPVPPVQVSPLEIGEAWVDPLDTPTAPPASKPVVPAPTKPAVVVAAPSKATPPLVAKVVKPEAPKLQGHPAPAAPVKTVVHTPKAPTFSLPFKK
jgi:hypothetical protein